MQNKSQLLQPASAATTQDQQHPSSHKSSFHQKHAKIILNVSGTHPAAATVKTAMTMTDSNYQQDTSHSDKGGGPNELTQSEKKQQPRGGRLIRANSDQSLTSMTAGK